MKMKQILRVIIVGLVLVMALGQKDLAKSGKGEEIPMGAIIMWSGKIIPAGWALCDGFNNTPDLRDRFIVGAGEIHQLNEVGGQNKVTLNVEHIPKHKHNVIDNGHTHDYKKTKPIYSEYGDNAKDLNFSSNADDEMKKTYNATTGIALGEVGEGKEHENRPSYHVLCFIMKL